MLEKQINGFIDYCKVSGFKDKSIESLSINLNKFVITQEPGARMKMRRKDRICTKV